MGVSVRSVLTTGVTTLTATAIVAAPIVSPPVPAAPPAVTWSVQNTASVAPNLFDLPAPPLEDAVVTPMNAASNVIDTVYAFTRRWANYASLDLAPWALSFVPFGYLVSDQIFIWYEPFVLAVTDAFVYDFLDPVVNDPLNLGVWGAGIGAIADAAINGVVAGIRGEINYVLSLQWLPFPVPPLPPWWPSLSSVASASAATEGESLLKAGMTLTELSESLGQAWNAEIQPAIQRGIDHLTQALDPTTWVPAPDGIAPADIAGSEKAPSPVQPTEVVGTGDGQTQSAVQETLPGPTPNTAPGAAPDPVDVTTAADGAVERPRSALDNALSRLELAREKAVRHLDRVARPERSAPETAQSDTADDAKAGTRTDSAAGDSPRTRVVDGVKTRLAKAAERATKSTSARRAAQSAE
ncbi:hypothetical protein [Mycobacterium sp. ACS4331]|uniref:hypothetical protein n=1 Tax=Mycobacterium sp. ACS4331 TaxID=1834121 RepID=UPI0007FEE0B2|nr:hypothetical protein [Mycobacterium sp. ACS4331]OBF14472.1 hypothetical protein A5727_15595 [Mycobacterium sp. ACS4331]